MTSHLNRSTAFDVSSMQSLRHNYLAIDWLAFVIRSSCYCGSTSRAPMLLNAQSKPRAYKGPFPHLARWHNLPSSLASRSHRSISLINLASSHRSMGCTSDPSGKKSPSSSPRRLPTTAIADPSLLDSLAIVLPSHHLQAGHGVCPPSYCLWLIFHIIPSITQR
jgi:hypothetical protein